MGMEKLSIYAIKHMLVPILLTTKLQTLKKGPLVVILMMNLLDRPSVNAIQMVNTRKWLYF